MVTRGATLRLGSAFDKIPHLVVIAFFQDKWYCTGRMDGGITFSGPHKNFEEIKKLDENGIEYWEARELMPLLGYEKWSNFNSVIRKAKIACNLSGQNERNHFTDVGKMIKIAIGSSKETIRRIQDYKLSRYACYLIAQNGKSSKQEVANAQTYFAIQTRRQELLQLASEDEKRLYVRGEVKKQNKKLFATAQKAGVTNFGKFNNMGYLGLYGMKIDKIKKKKGIVKDDILDRAGSTELAANLFRITQTDEKMRREGTSGQARADMTHYSVGTKVRKAIEEIGGIPPENLPAERHIKELEKVLKKMGTISSQPTIRKISTRSETEIIIKIPISATTSNLKDLKKILLSSPGHTSVILVFGEPGSLKRVSLPFTVKYTSSIQTQIKRILGS